MMASTDDCQALSSASQLGFVGSGMPAKSLNRHVPKLVIAGGVPATFDLTATGDALVWSRKGRDLRNLRKSLPECCRWRICKH